MYLDGTDSVRTDADANAKGFQVDLDIGTNTIKAQVTAEDGNTVQTYTVAVTRRADVTAPAAPAATVDGNVLVIRFDEALAPASNLSNSAFAVKKTPSGGSRDDGCACRLPLNQRRHRDIDACDCHIGFGLGGEGELCEAHHRHGQQPQRRKRQRGGELRRLGRDQ